jgi:hypothetical protein
MLLVSQLAEAKSAIDVIKEAVDRNSEATKENHMPDAASAAAPTYPEG